MKFLFIEMFDYLLLICMSLLILVGILFIYSSGVNSDSVSVSKEYIKQIIFACSGLLITIFFAVFDYRQLKRLVPAAFAVFLFVLIYTLRFGRYVNGASSWLGIGGFGIQPSEFGKIVYIMFLARYLESSETAAPLERLCKGALITAVPVLLILKQPDMGTASVYIPVFVGMLFASGVNVTYILFIVFTGALTVIFTILPVWQEVILKKTALFINVFTDNRLRLIVVTTLLIVTFIGTLGFILYRNRYYQLITWIAGGITLAFGASIAGGKY